MATLNLSRKLRKLRYSGCLISLPNRSYVFQLRDSKHVISNPGQLSTFGGRCLDSETPREAAVRELWEELRVHVSPSELTYVGYIEHYDEYKCAIIAATYFHVALNEGVRPACQEGSLYVASAADVLKISRLGPVTAEMLIRHVERQEKHPSTTDSGPMPLEESLIAIGTCLSSAIYEANVYWQRNAIYLALNSILLGGLLSTYQIWTPAILILVGFFGTVFNWHWFHVNRYSKFFAERWREDAREIARSRPDLKNYMPALLGTPRIPVPHGRRPSQVMNALTLLFRAVWIAVLLISTIWLLWADSLRALLTRAVESLLS